MFRTLIIANNVAILGKDVGRCAFYHAKQPFIRRPHVQNGLGVLVEFNEMLEVL